MEYDTFEEVKLHCRASHRRGLQQQAAPSALGYRSQFRLEQSTRQMVKSAACTCHFAGVHSKAARRVDPSSSNSHAGG